MRSTPRLTTPLLCAALLLAGCGGDSPSEPELPGDDGPVDTTPLAQLPPTELTGADLEPSGDVTETADGYRVQGELSFPTSDSTRATLLGADVTVRIGPDGTVRSISGRARIPSPHERIAFEDPVEADIGFFNGRFLNEQRDLGIALKDDTDYFVYDIRVTFQMNIATGETGAEATKPIVVRAPLGGRTLMVVDYADPMYYVFGSQDLIGSAGTGWSLKQRIPFAPAYDIEDLGAFDGGSIRTGSMTFFKIIGAEGTLVDNEYTELHLSATDPFSSSARRGYRSGINGAFALDLFVKDVVGIDLPLAAATAGVWAEASTDDLFRGHAFIRGETTNDFSWWPTFIPARPVAELAARAYVRHTGAFEVGLEGRYGWRFPDGDQVMSGGFALSDDAMTLTGAIEAADAEFRVTGTVTADATAVSIEPPQALLDAVAGDVRSEVMPRIDEAQAAWEDVKSATADYELELSLRGLRSALPGIVDRAKSELAAGINAAIAGQSGKPWQSGLRSHLRSADDPYYAQLDALKAAAQTITDNDATRAAIAAALRGVAARKIFTTTYRYKILGATVYSTTVRRRILSDQQANQLIEAADRVKYIQETSDRMLRMRQIYDQVDDRALFEQVRDDIQDGVLRMRAVEELGFVYPHGLDAPRFEAFARIDGTRYDLGQIPALTVEALLVELPDVMLDALTND